MAVSGEIGNGRIAGGDPSADEGSIPSSSTKSIAERQNRAVHYPSVYAISGR